MSDLRDAKGFFGPVFLSALLIASGVAAAEGTWTIKTELPAPRTGIHASTVDDKIYVIGGSVGGAAELSGPRRAVGLVEVYDTTADRWARLADMPTPRGFFGTAVVDGKIYCIGGSPNMHYNDPAISVVEVYDPATDRWARVADMPTPRADLTASAVNGKIYAIGGSRHVGVDALPIVEQYDPATDTWTRMADMLTPRLHLTSAVVDGKIYAVGGAAPEFPVPVAATEAYNPATDSWTRKADMPTARSVMWGVALNGKIYVMGGRGWEAAPLSTVEEYDPAVDGWATMADMPTPRLLLAVEAAASKIYAIGGISTNGTRVSTVEEFTPPIPTH